MKWAEVTLQTVPRLKTDFVRHSFSYAVPVIWNGLPADIMLCKCEYNLKETCKYVFFNTWF